MQKCNNLRNLLKITCKLPNSSHRYQVAKQQNIADMCRLSVTNTLPVYAKKDIHIFGNTTLSDSGLTDSERFFANNRLK